MRSITTAVAAGCILASVSATNNDANNNLRRKLQTKTVTYPSEEPYSTAITNPERGFYTQLTYFASSRHRLDASSLSDIAPESLILRMVYLDPFVDGSDISEDVLSDIKADFAAIRAAGVKCILRFAYTNIMEEGVITDPSKTDVLKHISQLKPILTLNQDVILSMQAGLVGPWGEWHGSTNFADDLEARQEIVAALLDAVPDRNVAIRTPKHKQALYTSASTDAVLHSSGHVSNGDFEGSDVQSVWSPYMQGFEIETSDFHGGSQSIKVDSGGARQWVNVLAGAGMRIEISGYSKRLAASGDVPYDYSIYADIKFEDGSYSWGHLAKFSGADSWNKAVHLFVVPAGKAVTGMSVYCMYRNAAEGYALFDDVAISVYNPPNIDSEAVSEGNAFDGGHISRTGHHNDCFLAGPTDYGTYSSPEDTDEYSYLAQETKYTSMGGETCNPSSRSVCVKAKEELEMFHYTYLNSGYHQDVIGSWKTDGCIDEIAARLGYRILLKTGSFGEGSSPGGTLPFSISLENRGYAAPINKRPVQLVLRETSTGALCGGISTEDVRTWYAGETHSLTGNLELPANFPEGSYDLFLNLGDESQNLRTNLKYKMQVANVGLNNQVTGMIDLQHSVTVAAGESSAPSNSPGESIDVVCGIEADVLPPAGVGPVTNGGFEGFGTEADWTGYMDGYTVDTTFKNSGLQSIMVSNGGARQSVSLEAVAGSQVTIKGYSKAVGTSTGLWDYGIYADVAYSDGTYLWGQIATFPGGTHDFLPSEKSFTVPAGKTVTGLTLYAMYRNDPIASGVAYFDDVEVIVKEPLVQNGGYEGNVDSAWGGYMDGYTVDTTFKNSGLQSIKITNGGARQAIPLDAEAGSKVTIKGYSKAVGTSTGLWDYGIYADVAYSDGSYLWGQIANFPGGDHDFTLAQKSFTVPDGKVVIGLTLYAMYRNDPNASGVAYFDDVEVIVE